MTNFTTHTRETASADDRQVLEVVPGVAMKTISNYTNHLADTGLDGAFPAHAWQPPREQVA